MPYVALQLTRDTYSPDDGLTTKAARTRFAVGKPDAANARSSQLAEVYGELTVTNA